MLVAVAVRGAIELSGLEWEPSVMAEPERSKRGLERILHTIRRDLELSSNDVVEIGGSPHSIRLANNDRWAEFGVWDLNQPFLKTDLGFGRTYIDEDASDAELEVDLRQFAKVGSDYVRSGASTFPGRRGRRRITVLVDDQPYDLWLLRSGFASR